jgi:hypothetical protein
MVTILRFSPDLLRCTDALEEFLHIRDTDSSAGVWMTSGYDIAAKSHPNPLPKYVALSI